MVMSAKSVKSNYLSGAQRAKLIHLVSKDRQLFSGKFTQSFTKNEARLRWQAIAAQVNAIPGAQKGWVEWRRSWQDLRSKTKRKVVDLKKQRRMTGGGSPPLGLSPQDEVVLSTIETNLLSGDIDSKEFKECCKEPPKTYIKEPQRISESMDTEPTTSKMPNKNPSKSKKTFRQRRLENSLDLSKSMDFKMNEKLTLKRNYLQIKKEYYKELLVIKKERNLIMTTQVSLLQDISSSINRVCEHFDI